MTNALKTEYTLSASEGDYQMDIQAVEIWVYTVYKYEYIIWKIPVKLKTHASIERHSKLVKCIG